MGRDDAVRPERDPVLTAVDYAATVIAERQAFSRLTYLLRVHGAKDSRLPAIDKAFATWRALAETIDTANHDAPHG